MCIIFVQGKHPVSALMEICDKRHWGAPQFTVVSESGPEHKKNFLFKVNQQFTQGKTAHLSFCLWSITTTVLQ